MNKQQFRAPGTYDPDQASEESGLRCDPAEGVTQQQFAEEVDINNIVRRFGLTGEIPSTNNMPRSGDFTGVVDFHTAMEMIRKAEEAFMEFPAELRHKFHHDPQELMQFLEDPNNRGEAEKLGLVQRPPEKTRDAVQAIDELAGFLKPQTPAKG